MNNFEKVMRIFIGLPTEKKEKLNPGVLGIYDCKQWDSFRVSLEYANENLVYEDDKLFIFSRVYKDTTFVNVIVTNEDGFNPDVFDYVHLKDKLLEAQLEATDKSIVFVGFRRANEATVSYCKKLCKSDRKNFIQGATYNGKLVCMEYYKPVPEFYKLIDMWYEDLYLDLGFIDHVKES